MRNQPRGSSPEKAPCLYSGRISRRKGSRDSISQPSAKAWRNSDCETRRGPSVPGVASLKQSRNRRPPGLDRKSTRLNSSHLVISYAVFCLKKKKKQNTSMSHILTIRSYTSSQLSSHY